uniref:SH3_10 domain-containing protein n=2 Tax=Schistosoma mansoni TaxID=6183 RepID=A0A5K4F489_SCHMA
MATESLQARLTDFERQARGVCIGVNHLALDSERVRQAELLQKIIQLEKDIQQSSAQKSHLPEAAAEIRDDVKNNTSALRYLETISQLENSFTVLTENVTETSVQLSAPKELKDEVHVKKELTGNVKSCWTYVSQLARLSQVHIRNAAEYHQFHHAVNEAEASLKARVRMTEPRNTRALPATLKNCTILANELREHLNHMIHLWGRSGNLLEESRRIVPVHLRLGGVIDGLSTNTESASPVMARMLTSLTGPNYELKEGEEVRVISNKDDQHFWTVQTNNGIVKIPSVCLWISDPDLEAVKRSVILREKCIESWDLLVERSRERLRSYYSCLLNQMAENGDIQYQHKIAMDNFLEDLRGLLLPNDTRATELSQAIYAFTDRLKMTDINRQRSPHGGVFLREQDIVCMHSPLLRLRDHERQMDHLRAQSELAGTHMTNYLREIDADQKRVDQELSLIDQLQHESQSQLDQLINRVKRWSSRYEHEPNVDSSISNSRMSSSLKSSTISDNWAGNNQMYPIDARSPQSIVRETSRLSSRTRSESIPRPVLDAITQIGVTTKTTGTQISHDDGDGGRNEIDLSISKRHFMPATIPERKQVRNAITQIGVSKVDAGTQDDYHGYSPKRSVKEVLCQIGQITANASCQTLEHYKLQQTLKKPTLDAVVQSGVITKNNSTQSEYITETVVKMDIPESQKAARKYSVLDAICQIGQVTQTTGTQTEVKNTERNKKNLGVQAEMKKAWQHTVNTNEAACQIGRITINASTEMSPMMVSKEEVIKQDIKKSDIICQIGKVEMTKSTQTNATEKLKTTTIKHSANQYEIQKASTSSQVDVLTEKTYKRTLKSVNDVICQVGQVNHEVSTQSVEYVTTRPAHKDTGIDPIHVWEKKTANDVVTQTGIVHTSKVTQAELIQEQPVYVKAIETQDVPITSYRNTVDAYQQADLIKHMLRKPSSDVVCQVGSVMESSGIQIDEPHKTSMLLAGTQSAKTPTHTKEIQTDMGFRMEPKFVSKAVNDVICQVGQVNHEVSTQSVEYVTTRPAHKDTGIDPIHVWEKKTANDVVTQTGIVHTSKITQAELIQEQPVYVKAIETQDVPITSYRNTVDAYQQADLIKHMLRKPSSDVVCQVGSVMESSGIQIDEPHKTSMLLAGTQSAKTPTHTKEIQTDMGFRMEPKFVSKAVNDVICQVGQVNHEVSTQSVEYVTTRPAHKDTGIDPIHVWEKKTANDVVTQTGIVHTSKITQAELIQEQPVYVKAIETQDVPITSYRNTVDAYQQADLIKHMLRKPSSDVVCQVGSVMESSGIQIDEPHKTSMLLAGTQSAKTPTHTKEIQTDMGFRMEPKFVSKAVNDVICQVGQVNHEVSTQSVEYKTANDVVTQTGIVHTSKVTQAELIQEQPVYVKAIETQDVPITSYRNTVDAYQQADLIKHMLRKPSSDVVCQVGSVMESSGIQIDEPHKTSMLLAGTQSAKTPTHTKEIQTDMGFRMEPKFVSKAVNDVICQVGQVNHEVSTQTGIPSTISVGVDPRPEVPVRHLGSYQVPPNIEQESRQVQADIKQTLKHIDMQTEAITRETLISTNLVKEKQVEIFDVTTQFDIVTKEKDVQTFVTCRSKETQTIESSPESEVKMRSQQTFTRIRSKNYDVQTQSGTINISQAFQTLLDYKPTTEKRSTGMQHEVDKGVVETTYHEPQTQETPTQTERARIKDQQTFTSIELKTFDVQTQFGSILKTQAAQTPGEQKTVVEVRDMTMQHHKSPEPIVHKKLQAIVQPPTINTETQTMVERPPPVILPPKVFDVQTQSGSVTVNSETQTPQEHRPVVATKDASVYHETRPVQSVPKKLQAIVVRPLENMATQTDFLAQPVVMPMVQTTHHEPQTQETPTQTERARIKDQQTFTSIELKTFDVQTQFGSILKTQAAQTPGEQKTVVEVRDMTMQHHKSPEPIVHKKLQAIVQPPTINTETQTMVERPPPVILPPKVFDVQTQSGTVTINSETQTPQEHRPIIEVKDLITQHEKRPEPIVHKKLQAIVQPPTINTETQTMVERPPPVILPPKVFDVQTQSGTVTINSETQTPQEHRPIIEVKDLITQHEKRPEPIVHKKLQAIVQPPTINTETQTMVERPPPVILPPKVFDVQTQSGTVTINSETQTPQEHRPVVATKDASVYHETRPVQSVPKKLQAIVVRPLENMATQTDFLAQPVVMPMVQTTHHEPQTQETPTQTERARIKDQQTFTSIELKTFDVQTQFGSILKTQAAQTPGEQKTVVEVRDMTMQHHKSPEPIVHKKLQAIVQPPTINTETQTMVEGPPPVILPPKVFDVQTQSGTVTINSETQTPQEHRPIIEVKDLITQHEKRPEPIVHKKLQAIVQPPTINTETQTMVERPPPVILPPKVFDVQTQSGTVTINSETQTPQEHRPIIEVKDLITQHEKRPEPIVHKNYKQ